VGRAFGLKFPPDNQIPKYSALPHDGMCEKMADKYLVRQAQPIPFPGQVGLFYVNARGVGQHFCVFAWHEATQRITMIHAFPDVRHVTEMGISEFWRKRLIRVYDYRECANV
jgi:hypothetical protein